MSGGKSICIIGAGPSGLCTLRHILTSKETIKVCLFEQQSDIGGVWNLEKPNDVCLYNDDGDKMVFPMYEGLTCNLPKQLMEFRDFKHFASSSHTFATRQEIHQYLVDYAEHFSLWQYINLSSRVVAVKPLETTCPEETQTWIVTVENIKTNDISDYNFDYVVSCVGVNYSPKIPEIDGIEQFKGQVLHSKYAKNLDDFRGKRVVCMGLGPSCADLCLRLAPIAKTVTACHRFPGGFRLGQVPENVTEFYTVRRLTRRKVVTECGEKFKCDVIILCTGYYPYFPFLPMPDMASCYCSITKNLYKKMFLPGYPSLCFINAHGIAQEFLLMEIQAKYFLALVEGKVALPSCDEMQDWVRKDQYLNINKSQSKLSESMRGDKYGMKGVEDYLAGLAEEAGFLHEFQDIALHLTVWQHVIGRIFGFLTVYREDKLNVISENKWEYVSATSTGEKKIRRFVLEDGAVKFTDEKVTFADENENLCTSVEDSCVSEKIEQAA